MFNIGDLLRHKEDPNYIGIYEGYRELSYHVRFVVEYESNAEHYDSSYSSEYMVEKFWRPI